MAAVNLDGPRNKEAAELRNIIADPASRNRDVQAARQRLADLERDRVTTWDSPGPGSVRFGGRRS